MPDFKNQARLARWWAAKFKGRDRHTITPLEIRIELAALKKAGYKNNTVNNRRTCLMAFYTALNHKSGTNPVRDVDKLPDDSKIPRDQSLMTIYRVLACMGPSKTRARLRVMLWTGWPQTQVANLRPEHIDWKTRHAYVTRRQKGKGHQVGYLPLLPGAIAALRAFCKAEAYLPDKSRKTGKPAKTWSRSAMHSAFARGVAKLNAHRARLDLHPLTIRPYDIRHSFGTWLAKRETDDRVVQAMMLLGTAAQTRRYTDGATASRVAAAVARLSAGTLPKPLPAPEIEAENAGENQG